MENCLVTTLKGSVNNENLNKLGHVIFTCDNTLEDEYAPDHVSGTPAETYRFRIYSKTTALTLKLIGTYFTDSNGDSLGTSTTDSQGRTVDTLIVPRADTFGTNVYIHRAPNTTTYLDIDHKYEWEMLFPITERYRNFAYRADCNEFQFTNPVGIWILNVPTNKLVNYSIFGKFIKIQQLTLRAWPPKDNFNLITCHLNDLAEAMIANGRDYTTDPKLDIETFPGMTYYNGTNIVTLDTSYVFVHHGFRIIFKSGGYEIREGASDAAPVLYDSTAN